MKQVTSLNQSEFTANSYIKSLEVQLSNIDLVSS